MSTLLHRPICVFDAGIGSFSLVKAIHQHYPEQDLIYFADRVQSPYSLKTKQKLKKVILAAIQRLAGYGAELVVLASNAPSVSIFDEIKDQCPVPVIPCYPPVQAGVKLSKTKELINLGTQALLVNPEFRFYIQTVAPEATVHICNASELVHLVESGDFLTKPKQTEEIVKAYMDDVLKTYPNVDVCTVSSSHLPWIIDQFKKAAPNIQFVSSQEHCLQEIKPYVTQGTGKIWCIATANESHPLSELQQMFDILHIGYTIELVE